jgi:hypothetical protein
LFLFGKLGLLAWSRKVRQEEVCKDADSRGTSTFDHVKPSIFEWVELLLSRDVEIIPPTLDAVRTFKATKDLFTPHPSIPNAWKYFARLDDTIVLTNGEKVTPTAFEQSIRDNKLVKEAVMFGSGKARVRMIIIPSDAAGNLSSDDVKISLHPVIAKGNHEMPGYAQLSLDMVRVMPAGTEYPYKWW